MGGREPNAGRRLPALRNCSAPRLKNSLACPPGAPLASGPESNLQTLRNTQGKWRWKLLRLFQNGLISSARLLTALAPGLKLEKVHADMFGTQIVMQDTTTRDRWMADEIREWFATTVASVPPQGRDQDLKREIA